MTVSDILLRRKSKIIIGANDEMHIQDVVEKQTLTACLKNIETLGFTFSKGILSLLSHFDYEEIVDFYNWIFPSLKQLTGAYRTYKLMYPNFPMQVAEASDGELFFNAVVHYLSNGQLLPNYEKKDRLPLIGNLSLTTIYMGSFEEIWEIVSNLFSGNTSISLQDKEDIIFMMKEYPKTFWEHIPEEIPFKENAALLGKLVLQNCEATEYTQLLKYFKTTTDVLRLIVALSDGDISLAKPTKFKSIPRKIRRAIMSLLNNCKCSSALEDMFRYREYWIRVGEILHPFEFKQYSDVNALFYELRNGKKPCFFNGEVEKMLKAGNVKEASDLLCKRPGEFARKLDTLLRKGTAQDDIFADEHVLEKFRAIVDEVSTPVLLQLRTHFIDRNNELKGGRADYRVFFPKGQVAKSHIEENRLEKIPHIDCQEVVSICNGALIRRFKTKSEVEGKVYINPIFQSIAVPFSQRSASKTYKAITRGSKIAVNPNNDTIRAFVWWTDSENKGRVDIDLSATIYNENWGYVNHLSYTHLRDASLAAYHSGDITSGGPFDGQGVSEFIDIPISEVYKNQGRYVVFQVFSYTRQKFSDLEHLSFGWMEREYPNSGEVFEPRTVKMCLDINSESTTCVPVIFDCKERRFIWCDMTIKSNTHHGGNNVESNFDAVAKVGYAMTHIGKPSLFELIALQVEAVGEFVDNPEDADFVFDNEYNPSERNRSQEIYTIYDTDIYTKMLS